MKWNVSGGFDRGGFRLKVEPANPPPDSGMGGVKETGVIQAGGAPAWLLPAVAIAVLFFFLKRG